MDKHEYRLKTEQMLKYAENQSYKEAFEIAESIDWGKVKNVSVLCAVSEIYEYNGEYQKSRDVLFMAYDRSPDSKKIVYRLGTLALKLGEIKEAMDCYEEFKELAPKDPNQYIFQYKILKSRKAPIEEQIAVLEAFKQVEYVEKWAFELASLYKEAGMITECLEACDDLILWFSEGKYIYKAMEMKMQYKPLTPLQHEKYMNRPELKAQQEEVQQEEAPQEEVQQEEVKQEEVEQEEVAQDEIQQEEVSETPATEESATQEVETMIGEAEVESAAEEIVESENDSAEEVEAVEEETTEESETPTEKAEEKHLSIEEIVQDWQEQQIENAQMIQAEIERVEQEKAKAAEDAEEVEEEKEELLPDDVRKLMEELEAESAEIDARKTATDSEDESVEESKPLLQKVVEQLSSLDVKLELPGKDASVPVVAPVETPEVPLGEIEEIEDEDEDEGIKLGNTQDVALSAKALANAAKVDAPVEEELEETPEEIAPVPENPYVAKDGSYDTDFVITGKYELETQSEVGLKAGLTEEQKKLFSYFVPVHGMSEQLVKVLHDDKNCKSRYGTSRIGNILVIGRRGSGKTVLAVDIVKAIQKARRMKQGKVAIVKAEALNKKEVTEIIEKLHGGALIVEKASRLKRKTIDDLCEVMEGQTGELLVVLEDERKPMDRMLSEYPNFKKKFTSRVELPVFINDELVTFGQTYAKENGYKIDEMGILALYSDIDMLQREEKIVTVADVKALVDDAIENSNRASVKKFVKKVLGRNKDESDRIILKEEDFR